ncbi:MAG: hypothetical protein IKB28_03360 [Clostridia bacterium]|nr:hypothetical protein [Clostridia bacterium]
MTKKFIKNNRGQVLYAVVVTVMFVGVLSMITMGMTLKNYQNAVKKQENLRNYYAADAVVEMIRVDLEKTVDIEELENKWPGMEITNDSHDTVSTEYIETYTIKYYSVTIKVGMKVVEEITSSEETTEETAEASTKVTRTIISWEVRYNAE